MKKILLAILTLMLFCPFMINAEEIKLDWENIWGGSDDDYFNNILQTRDGGYVVYGTSYSTDIEGLPTNGYPDAIIVKYDKDGKTLWQKNWGGNGSDEFHGAFQTSDGGFIVYGTSRSADIEGLPNNGEDDVIIVKYDKDGNMLWQKNWGGNYDDRFVDTFQTTDGGFIASVSSTSTDIEGLSINGYRDAIIVKYDKDGNILWQKNWGGNGRDLFVDTFQTTDGGFIAYGSSESTDIEGLPNNGFVDEIIVKYDKDGNILWQKDWGGNSIDEFDGAFQTSDGGFIAYGSSESTDIEGLPINGYRDAIIVKYDKDGNILWQKNWGGNDYDVFDYVFQTTDGGFIAYGSSESTDIEGLPNNGDNDAIIVKYDKDGNMLWQKSYGGSDIDTFDGVFQTSDGNFIVYGSSGTKMCFDAIIVKYDKDGNMLWQKNWGGNDDDIFVDTFQTTDGGFIAYGYSNSTDIEGLSNNGEYDAIIVKYDKDGNMQWQKSYGGNSDDEFDGAFQTSDGKFVVYGFSGDKGERDIILLKYSIEYDLENTTAKNGISTVVQQGKYGIITPTPNNGYEVDQIIIKDKNGEVLDLEVTKLEGGTYSFELFADVSVEVTFKEKIENPKTGIIDVITILFVGAVISLCGFILVKKCNERYEI